MSAVQTGNPATVTTQLAATVTAASNATPIVITTSANHNYGANGDQVYVTGVTGNTAANGVWTIVVLSSTTFSLTGSVGNGAYVSGGTVKGLSLTPQTTMQSDGDVDSAANRNVAVQTCLDRTQFLGLQLSPLADLTALASILAPTNGLVRHVIGFGSYVFQTSATTGLSPFRVAATDATAGGWVASSAHQTTLTRMAFAPNLPLPGILSGATAPYDPTGTWTNFINVLAAGNADVNVQNVSGSIVGLQWNTAVAAGSAIAKALRFGGIDNYLIDGATLSTVTAKLRGAAGHVALPLLMPQFAMVRTDQDGNRVSLGALVSDTSANTAAYQASHSVVYSPSTNNVIDKSQFSYEVWLWGEGNTNALAGLLINSFAFAHTAIPDGRRS